MRHKRAKTYKRLMAVYVQTFGFRQPFQVLGQLPLGCLPCQAEQRQSRTTCLCTHRETRTQICRDRFRRVFKGRSSRVSIHVPPPILQLRIPRQNEGLRRAVITQCCMESLYKLGRDQQRTTDLAKSFERRKCNHRTALEPDACLKDMIGECPRRGYRRVLSMRRGDQQTQLRPCHPILWSPRRTRARPRPSGTAL